MKRLRTSTEWETPTWVFTKLNERFHFDVDVCASASNWKVLVHFTKEDDALCCEWHGCIWMNPPYDQTTKWLAKALQEVASRRCTVVALLPVRSDSRWWHSYVVGHASELMFVKGRLRFKQQTEKGYAPFASCVVVFRHLEGGAPTTAVSTLEK